MKRPKHPLANAPAYFLLGGEGEVFPGVVAGDAGHDFAEDVVILGEAAVLHPFAQQAAENAAEILVAGIGEEGTAVGQHAHEARQVAQGGQGGQLIGHAGEMVVEPPGGAVLKLADGLAVLEAAAEGVDGLVVRRVQAVQDGAGQTAPGLHLVEERGHLRHRRVVADGIVAGVRT